MLIVERGAPSASIGFAVSSNLAAQAGRFRTVFWGLAQTALEAVQAPHLARAVAFTQRDLMGNLPFLC